MGSLIDKYSREELENIVQSSFSYAEVLSKLGYSTSSGNNSKTLKKRLNHYNISTEHFIYIYHRQDWTDEEIFCENSSVSQNKLRKTFKERNFVPYKCSICGLDPVWNGNPLVLTLDHKNGQHKDNRINNLRWVCPNCDRQLDTYGMKNKKDLKKNVILYTGNYDNRQQINKKKSNNTNQFKITPPDRQELKDKLWECKNYTMVANHYNISTTLIRKWCRMYGLPATIDIVKYTSESGWIEENWNDVVRADPMVMPPKPCYMVDKDSNQILMEFESRRAAGKYIAPNKKNADAHIGAVCSGKRYTAYGYKWKDKDGIAS